MMHYWVGRSGRVASVLLGLIIAGCRGPAELTGYPVSTPIFHPENRLFYPAPLAEGELHGSPVVRLEQVYEVTGDGRQAVRPNDPLAVVLQSVRIPEHTYAGTRDIAVVLDIQTDAAASAGPVSLVAFYQRDVPAGQALNFSNLLVYAVPEWDGTTPPYFRVRVLDVRAERNRRAAGALESASRLAGTLGGLSPHPLLPLVSEAIYAAGQVLANRENRTLLDYQVQLFGTGQVSAAGQADLPRLYTGPWLVVGRERDPATGRPCGAESWARPLYLDRRTGQLLGGTEPPEPRDMPYVSIVVMREDLQVPGMVLARSRALLALLSSSEGRSDTDALEAAATGVASAVRAYAAERDLVRFHTRREIGAAVGLMETPLAGLPAAVSEQQQRRLLRVLNRYLPASAQLATPAEAVAWWRENAGRGAVVRVVDQGEGRWEWRTER